jgi:phosphate acetyltransferase
MARGTGTGKYEQLLARCGSLAPVPTAVAYPCEETALSGAIEAGEKGLITPILVGPPDKIREVARAHGIELSNVRVVEAASSPAASAKAVELVRKGEAEVLMKGSLHTDELLGAVVARETGLRTGRRISHVFIMDVPTYHKVLVVTDAAINIAPALEDKVDICQNAIDLAQALGVTTPKVAILAAVETINSKMPATIDAAALCKMAERGQIKGGFWMGRWRSTTRSARRRRRSRGSGGRLRGTPTFCWPPIWRRATSLPSS